MNNYKIKVNDEAENVVIQNAFFALGYGWGVDCNHEVVTSKNMIDEGYSSKYKIAFMYAGQDGRLLNGNDSADGHRSYIESDDQELTLPQLRDLVAQEQGLISGAEALRALADGKEVEANNIDFGYWIDARNLSVTDFFDDLHTFRLKPRTTTLSLDIPAPFEPKDGEEAWCLDGAMLNGYKKVIFNDFDLGIGFWRTEEEIKQVVAALRGIKG